MSAEVVNLDDHRPHQASYLACMKCGKDWVGVFPSMLKRLQCPKCGAMAGEPVQIHNTEWVSRFMRGKNRRHRTMVCINAKMMEGRT